MIAKDRVFEVLESVVHPDTGEGLSAVSRVGDGLADGRIEVELKFARPRDPFAGSLRRAAERALKEAFPEAEVSVSVATPPAPPAARASAGAGAANADRTLAGVDHIIAVASAKGGVGKSTVAARLAGSLAGMGFRVGVLDADIYGPSQPELFGLTGYLPVAEGEQNDPAPTIVPGEAGGVKIMSIGFFIDPSDALVWRGPMAVNALRQLIHQTAWGGLDFLLVDLPPGTGDVHLSLVQQLKLSGAVVVTTPQSLALADVRRGVEMFRGEGIEVPVLGLVENMSWFSPPDAPGKRYYIFGQGGGRKLARELGVDFLGELPIVPQHPGAAENEAISAVWHESFDTLAHRVVDKLHIRCQ